MSNAITTLPASFGAPSTAFAAGVNDDLSAGVASSYGVIGYRGKVWSIKYQGTETPLLNEAGDGARASIEVVIVRASPARSKIFYANGYQDGSNSPPDCWSSNGITPDASVNKKENPTCAGCPRDTWGSRVTDAGKQGKQCSDSRRVAVVPINDIMNEAAGGPMLLRIPAASLKDLKAYGEVMNSHQFAYYAVVTKISFDIKEAYPKFVFTPVRPLTDEEAKQVLALRDDPRTSQLLADKDHVAAPEAEAPPTSIFTQPTAAKAPTPAPKPTAVAPKPAAKPAAKAATAFHQAVQEPLGDEMLSPGGTVGDAPADFDAMLDSLV